MQILKNKSFKILISIIFFISLLVFLFSLLNKNQVSNSNLETLSGDLISLEYNDNDYKYHLILSSDDKFYKLDKDLFDKVKNYKSNITITYNKNNRRIYKYEINSNIIFNRISSIRNMNMSLTISFSVLTLITLSLLIYSFYLSRDKIKTFNDYLIEISGSTYIRNKQYRSNTLTTRYSLQTLIGITVFLFGSVILLCIILLFHLKWYLVLISIIIFILLVIGLIFSINYKKPEIITKDRLNLIKGDFKSFLADLSYTDYGVKLEEEKLKIRVDKLYKDTKKHGFVYLKYSDIELYLVCVLKNTTYQFITVYLFIHVKSDKDYSNDIFTPFNAELNAEIKKYNIKVSGYNEIVLDIDNFIDNNYNLENNYKIINFRGDEIEKN